MIITDEIFLEFLKSWKRKPISVCWGLCTNFKEFLIIKSLEDGVILPETEAFIAYNYMNTLFGSEMCPFNDLDGKLSYFYENVNGTCHLNPNRVKWVDDKIAELERKLK